MSRKESEHLFSLAQKFIPGGVNSPVRAFKSVGGQPIFFSHGSGAYLFDVDGNRYIDFVLSWGPLILGHAPQVVLSAIQEAAERGTSFGAPTRYEVEMAELLTTLLPALEKVRLVNSGTEATMTAVRLARAFTGRPCIIKFNGCYHGHADTLLVKAGSGVATLGIAGSPGIPEQIASLTISIEFNDPQLLEDTVRRLGREHVAAVIIEPVAGNMGLVLPKEGYLEAVRDICTANGIVLIFDEVMTGFRVALGGAQERFKITPDLTTLGKVIGGGLPVGAVGGRKEIMSLLAPEGPVYQAGTLSGNPLAVAAGLAVLKSIQDRPLFTRLESLGKKWAAGMNEIGQKLNIPVQANSCGSMIGMFFSSSPVLSFQDTQNCNAKLYPGYFRGMLDEGVYFAPSAFEAAFLSAAHTDRDVDIALDAAEKVLSNL